MKRQNHWLISFSLDHKNLTQREGINLAVYFADFKGAWTYCIINKQD